MKVPRPRSQLIRGTSGGKKWATLAHMEASHLAAFSYLQPLLAIVFGVLILHERVTLALVVSGLVIFGGVCVAERAR